MKTFITIKDKITTQIVEKKSKFIAKLYYVENKEDINEIIKSLKKQYNDARHHCVAYRIFQDNIIIEKANDDGEPSGTAGAPMLKILQNNNLCNVLIVVIRYFGGVLLGTGGLVRAYSECLQKAINEAKKVKRCIGEELQLTINYSEFEKIKYYCEKCKINISNIEYKEDIVCKLDILEGQTNKILEDFKQKSINIKEHKNLGKKFIIIED